MVNMNNVIMVFLAGMLLMTTSCSHIPLAAADLNGQAGKLFDADMSTQSFRFLIQDCQYETGIGNPWYTAHWSDDTSMIEQESRANFRDIKGPVVAIFTGMTNEDTAAMEKGELFRADKVILRPDLKEASGISADGQTISGWFTPRQAKFSRDGKLKVDGKEIPAGVKRGGTRIFIEQQRTAPDLTNGSWKVTLKGSQENGRFVASEMLLNPLTDYLAVDDPNLPRVLSVGDSISMNYEDSARAGLKGIANYHRIGDNCWSTARGKAFMHYWLGDYTRKGHGWDLIVFNSGMHDMKQKKLGGAYAVPLDQYKKNLIKEIEIMQRTGAKLAFVSTTPVPNDCGNADYAFRSKGAEEDFNRAAREVLKNFPEIHYIDLAKVVHESSVMDKWRTGKDVHYWNSHEQAVLGKAISEAVKSILEE